MMNERALTEKVSSVVLAELKENYLESVMISLPNYGAKLTLNEFMPLWRVVEDYIDKQKILSAGVCDFMLPLFADICDAAKVQTSDHQYRLSSKLLSHSA
jgi:diketogulonate reductase-like aldo/keto reductase